MKLSAKDQAHFHALMRPLEYYVNHWMGILPGIRNLEDYAECFRLDQARVRARLYANLGLIDKYVAENPFALGPADLEIVHNWKRSLSGEFYVERFLSRGSVWISSADNLVFLVAGLARSAREIFNRQELPIWVEGVLLPFKGRIVLDEEMLQVHNIFFGKEARVKLKEAYLAARRNGRLVESLEPGRLWKRRQPLPAATWQANLDEVVKASRKLRGNREEPVRSRAFSLLRASVKLSQAAIEDPEDMDALWQQARKVERALNQLENALSRAQA